MKFGVITLFPEMFEGVMSQGVLGRAIGRGDLAIEYWNPRDFTVDKHRTVDDRPYGGGPGMLMKVEPLEKAIHAAKAVSTKRNSESAKVIYLSPQGKPLSHGLIEELAAEKELILIAGRYEGIDERVIETHVDQEVSLGDFVVSGGELPAMVLIDAISRLIPGVLGHEKSALEDSFVGGLLDCPHYTRPEEVAGMKVPDVLLQGNHEEIRKWRLKQSLGRTWTRRPDLLEGVALDAEMQSLLEEFIDEVK